MASNIQKMDLVGIDLNQGTVYRSWHNHAIGMKDNKGDAFGILVYRDKEPVDLTGISVQGYYKNPQGTNIAITTGNTVEGNMAYVVLPQACYDYDGQFTLAIKLIGGGITGTMRIVDGMVNNTNVDGAVAPTGTVPTYQEVLSVFEQMQDALEEYDEKVTEQDGKIDDLKSAIGNIKEIYEKCGREDIIPQQYGQSSVVLYGGGTGTYDNWYNTDFISCVPGECYHFGAWGFYNGTINICPVSFFDSNKQYIDGVSSVSLPTYQSANNRRYDDIIFIPANAAYYKQAYLSVGGIDNFTKKIVLVGTQSIIELLDSALTWKVIDITTDKTDIPLYGGGTSTYINWFSTDYIDCSHGLKLDIVAWGFFADNINISPISFYDSNKNYLSSISGEEGSTIPNYGRNRLYRGQVYIPSNAKYFRLASYQGVGASVYPISASEYVYNITQDESVFISKLKVVCIGDSLTEGDQGADPYASAQNITPYNYPYWMQKYLGCRVINKGKSGYTTIQSWNNVVQSIDFTDVNTVVIMLGSNGGLTDTIDTDCPDGTSYTGYANTNTGCYCKIIEYCMAQTSGAAQIILCTPPHIGKVRGQKRTTTIAAAEVVRKIAARYCLPLIDMMAESGFSDFNEDVYQPVDGLHFSVDGYKRMGTFIGSRVKSNNAIQSTF